MSKNSKWMQKAVKNPGALRRQLGVKSGQTIPASTLQKIRNAKVGSTIKIGGESRRITPTLKRRAVLALTFKKYRKK